MTSSSGSRVSIPADLRKTIQNIRETTGKQHSDEDIYSVFKECFNDPHETAQRLLYLDTFQEVKSKRERKKENLLPNTQGRGRNGRRNFASSYNDVNNGRSAASNRQSGANQIIGGSKTSLPAPDKALNGTVPRSIKAPKPRSPVNKRVTKEQPLSKSTSSSEDVVELVNSKASTVPVAVTASDSVVQKGTQYAVDRTCQISEQSSTSTKQDYMLIANSKGNSQSDQVTRSEAVANKSKNQSLIEPDGGVRPHVTFPVHLAKTLENGLTFGSFGSNLVKETYSDNCTIGCDDSNIESSHGTAAYEASAREEVSTLSPDKEHVTPNSAPETELALQSDQTVNHVEGSEGDKPKEEFLPITDTQAAPPISYPDQFSIAASQQAMQLFRQQYPPNFFPYGPYFPPFYMPQPYITPFMTPIGLQQPPGDDAPTPKESTTVPSPNDSLNHIPSAAATINSTHNEERKENIYTNGALSAWMAAQSLANLQINHMYNLALQGQALPFPTGFNGLYQQQTHPILAAPTMNQTLPPPPAISAMTEPIGLPLITNQQTSSCPTNESGQ